MLSSIIKRCELAYCALLTSHASLSNKLVLDPSDGLEESSNVSTTLAIRHINASCFEFEDDLLLEEPLLCELSSEGSLKTKGFFMVFFSYSFCSCLEDFLCSLFLEFLWFFFFNQIGTINLEVSRFPAIITHLLKAFFQVFVFSYLNVGRTLLYGASLRTSLIVL